MVSEFHVQCADTKILVPSLAATQDNKRHARVKIVMSLKK